jgi:hypothetical protein
MKGKLITIAVGLALIAAFGHRTQATELKLEASSASMIWNAVAVDGKRVFVAGPRWTGSAGPSLALLGKDGQLIPYPDGAWNAWHAGGDAAFAFVNINAIHLDGKGGLWAVDTGSPSFGGDPLPGAAKVVKIDLKSGKVARVMTLGPDLALPGSYIDDIRFNGGHAYLTDAGRPALIVLDLESGKGRRVLQDAPAVTARKERVIDVDGTVVRDGTGAPLMVNADPFELSADGKTLFFGPLGGPWSQIETRLLDAAQTSEETLAGAVRPWADIPPIGGSVLDRQGNLYYTDLKSSSLMKRTPDGAVTTVISDKRLHWVDAPVIDAGDRIWLPVPQMDRVGVFNGGKSRIEWPVSLYSLQLPRD